MSDLSELPPLRDIIRDYNLRADKSLGQNFLLDLNLTRKIVRQAGTLSGVHVIEIGPGPGGLTRALLESDAAGITAIEYDPRAVAALQPLVEAGAGRLRVVEQDALKTDIASLQPQEPCAIIANLPYNIATPLLIGWLKQIRSNPDSIHSMTLMFQREVAERITASPGGKTYGRLSVMSQWLCNVDRVMDLPPHAFTPPPKISSSIVHFVPKGLPDGAPDFEKLEHVVATAFNQRRKMLRSALKSLHPDIISVLESCAIDPQSRAETLSLDDYLKLAHAIN